MNREIRSHEEILCHGSGSANGRVTYNVHVAVNFKRIADRHFCSKDCVSLNAC